MNRLFVADDLETYFVVEHVAAGACIQLWMDYDREYEMHCVLNHEGKSCTYVSYHNDFIDVDRLLVTYVFQ